MNQLETLLYSLIKMGWKLFDLAYITKCEVSDHGIYFYEGECTVEFCSLRELVSLESGLWRFVCMHSLISEKADMRDYREDSFGFKSKPIDPDGEYRIIRSALVPEEELAQFLVDNIVIEGE